MDKVFEVVNIGNVVFKMSGWVRNEGTREGSLELFIDDSQGKTIASKKISCFPEEIMSEKFCGSLVKRIAAWIDSFVAEYEPSEMDGCANVLQEAIKVMGQTFKEKGI